MADISRALAIVERGHRGGVETQFADVFYLVRELNRQLGRLDLMLRGAAVTCAVTTPTSLGEGAAPGRAGGDRPGVALPDTRVSLRTLLADGMSVSVDGADLAALGLSPNRVLAGVTVTDGAADAREWLNYHGVWFL